MRGQPKLARLLRQRLRWFVTLRWIAVTGLLVAPLGALLGFPLPVKTFILSAAIIALYNGAFTIFIRRTGQGDGLSDRALSAFALTQVALDLIMVAILVHSTGGSRSPFLLYYTFHMVIGSILLPRSVMFLVAALVSLATAALFFLEGYGLLGHYSLSPALAAPQWRVITVTAVIMATGLMGIVYLVSSISSQIWEEDVALSHHALGLERLSQRLAEDLELVRAAEGRKSKFMRFSAHQLRSPLASIQTSLAVLRDGYVQPSDPRFLKVLDGAYGRTTFMLSLVQDLLHLARIREVGADRVRWETLDLAELVRQVAAEVGPFAESRGVRVLAEAPGDAPMTGMRSNLVHALHNVVHNAVKYSPQDGTVRVSLAREAEGYRVEVMDQGIGVPAESLEEIFHEFYRAPNAYRAAEGTGLGLAISREILRQHGGDIRVFSQVGQGSTFTLLLREDGSPGAS